jgi:MazG family protein
VTAAPPPIARLLAVMARLRDRERGCPWDVEQTFATIAPYTIEEAYEVADAIERGDLDALKEELGDLLFQVVFHARMAEEAGLFDFAAVTAALADKMVQRHPHVFGAAVVAGAAAQSEAWEAVKERERAAKAAAAPGPASALDAVPANLPALARAQKIQKRASRVGFDWGAPGPALDKVEEEIREARERLPATPQAEAPPALVEEVGDLLFALVNVARLAGVDAETALRRATLKFERRFRRVEAALAERGKRPEDSTLAEMDRLWDAAKAAERGDGR